MRGPRSSRSRALTAIRGYRRASQACGITRPAGAMAEKNYITPDGYKRLVDELTELATVERPKVVREVSDAAAEGDRSENAAYIYGKRRLREIDRRMGFLQRRLKDIEIVKAEPGRD